MKLTNKLKFISHEKHIIFYSKTTKKKKNCFLTKKVAASLFLFSIDLKPQDQTTSHLSSSKSVISSYPSLSTLNKSKGFLIENPDGTLIQGIIFR